MMTTLRLTYEQALSILHMFNINDGEGILKAVKDGSGPAFNTSVYVTPDSIMSVRYNYLGSFYTITVGK